MNSNENLRARILEAYLYARTPLFISFLFQQSAHHFSERALRPEFMRNFCSSLTHNVINKTLTNRVNNRESKEWEGRLGKKHDSPLDTIEVLPPSNINKNEGTFINNLKSTIEYTDFNFQNLTLCSKTVNQESRADTGIMGSSFQLFNIKNDNNSGKKDQLKNILNKNKFKDSYKDVNSFLDDNKFTDFTYKNNQHHAEREPHGVNTSLKSYNSMQTSIKNKVQPTPNKITNNNKSQIKGNNKKLDYKNSAYRKKQTKKKLKGNEYLDKMSSETAANNLLLNTKNLNWNKNHMHNRNVYANNYIGIPCTQAFSWSTNKVVTTPSPTNKSNHFIQKILTSDEIKKIRQTDTIIDARNNLINKKEILLSDINVKGNRHTNTNIGSISRNNDQMSKSSKNNKEEQYKHDIHLNRYNDLIKCSNDKL